MACLHAHNNNQLTFNINEIPTVEVNNHSGRDVSVIKVNLLRGTVSLVEQDFYFIKDV